MNRQVYMILDFPWIVKNNLVINLINNLHQNTMCKEIFIMELIQLIR